MQNARKQAEDYVFLLDADHPAPPFIITCDVGHCFRDLSRTSPAPGAPTASFPDRKGFRIYLEDLRERGHPQTLLAQIWTDPHALDPARESARVTREIAKRLAEVSKALEERGITPEEVAHFLMRCIFTMFAEDVDLLPKDSFKPTAGRMHRQPRRLRAARRGTVGEDGRSGEDASPRRSEARVRYFNGNLFKDATRLPPGARGDRRIAAAAKHKWTEVDPAIFGTLLEQALDQASARSSARTTRRAPMCSGWSR